MSLLKNPRQEHFAQLVATGQSLAQAYAAAGYEEKTAYTCGPRLLKRTDARARVSELQQRVAQTAVSRTAIDREFVLRELMDNALKAKQDQAWSASTRALELLGRELGMFTDRLGQVFWDGNPATLTNDQLAQLLEYELRAVYGDDQEKIAATRRQAEVAAGVVDVEPEPVAANSIREEE